MHNRWTSCTSHNAEEEEVGITPCQIPPKIQRNKWIKTYNLNHESCCSFIPSYRWTSFSVLFTVWIKLQFFFSLLNYDKINTILLYFVKELWLMNKACKSLMQPRCIVSYVISSTLSTIDEISLMAFAFHLPRTSSLFPC